VKGKLGKAFIWLIIIASVSLSMAMLLQGQKKYPSPKSDFWEKLSKCKVSKNYRIDFTDEIKNLDNKIVSLDGYIIPIESTEKFNHFLLSFRSTTCSFCPPSKPNEIIEVFTKESISWQDSLQTISGKLQLGSNISENGLFFKIIDAKVGSQP
jgi:hypothetical protein